MTENRFQQAIEKIDVANAEDPNGIEGPHAQRRTEWIHKLVNESASEELLLAARGQHIRRWEIPRASYPRGRVGYLTWRTDLKKYHAKLTAEILAEVGYDQTTIERVSDLIQKKRLKHDAETQALEDALCLVFLEKQFSDFAQKEADKIGNILRKTWQKMSARGQELALQLPMSDTDRAIVEQALQVTSNESTT